MIEDPTFNSKQGNEYLPTIQSGHGAEFIGTALLLIVVVGSGIMGQQLSLENTAVALLGNSIATCVSLYVLISLAGPISGVHFNPAVTLTFWWKREISSPLAIIYVFSQILGGIIGVWLTHAMFDLPIIQTSRHVRTGSAQWLSESIATSILLTTVHLGIKNVPQKVPLLVALIVTDGYWFTPSTFSSNPAVTIARGITDTFSGITLPNIPGFIATQIIAGICGSPFLL